MHRYSGKVSFENRSKANNSESRGGKGGGGCRSFLICVQLLLSPLQRFILQFNAMKTAISKGLSVGMPAKFQADMSTNQEREPCLRVEG